MSVVAGARFKIRLVFVNDHQVPLLEPLPCATSVTDDTPPADVNWY